MEEKHVFGKGYTGGPHNFGDPNDRSMRHVEDNIFVTQIIRNRAHHEKCKDFVKKWGECMEDNSFGLNSLLTFYTCKKQVDEMNKCLKFYYLDKEFKEECTNIYLDKRTRFRETGVIEKDPFYKKPYYESERKRDYVNKHTPKKNQESNTD